VVDCQLTPSSRSFSPALKFSFQKFWVPVLVLVVEQVQLPVPEPDVILYPILVPIPKISSNSIPGGNVN